MGKLAILPVIAALLLFAAVTLVAAQQPPFPLEGGTVEVEYANRIFQLSQNPELLQFARMFRETVCINLTMPVENPETFREGSNYKINCLPWLMMFPGGQLTWYRAQIDTTTGVREEGGESIINPELPPGSVEVRGEFNAELFITSTLVSPAQQQTTAGIYTCEVCIETLREDGQCHNSSVVTFNIGSPPVIDDTTPEDTSFVEEPGFLDIRNYRVGSSPCLSDPPRTTPLEQGEDPPDPADALRIRCDLLNEFETDEFPQATPGPIIRRWYFNGVLVYEAVVGIFPNLNPDFLAMFPSLDPDNDLLVYGNDGFISIGTDPEDAFANRTDLSFAAVYGNWTCSIRNPLGTDVARFGTLLRECVGELDLSFIGNSPRLGTGMITAELFTNRPGVQIVCFLRGTNFRQDCSNGSITFTGIPAGRYTLQVIATDRVTSDTAEIRTPLFVPGSDEFCSVYALNQLVNVAGGSTSAEFRSTGRPAGFQCRVDRQSYFPCTSPVMITGLESGRHVVRVRPQGCGRAGSGHRSLSIVFNV